jgi:hypothetical protein
MPAVRAGHLERSDRLAARPRCFTGKDSSQPNAGTWTNLKARKGGASGDKAVGELGTRWVGRDWLAADAEVVTGGEQWEGGAPGEAGWEEAIIPLFVE